MDNQNQPDNQENDNEIAFEIDYNAALGAVGERIGAFFKTISTRIAEDIWEFMSDDFKRRSLEEHNSEKYSKLFEEDTLPTRIGIDNVTMLSPHKIECTAACEINVGRLKSLRKVYFQDRSLKSIGEIGGLVESRVNQMFEIDPEKAKIIERVSLDFDLENGVWYWTAFAINYGDMSGLILDPFKELIIRTFEFSCIQVDGVWLVDNVYFLGEEPKPLGEEEQGN